MTNPFAMAVKLEQRALDELRQAIAGEQERLACLEARDAVIVAIRASERARATRDPALPPTRWFARVEQERTAIAREREAAERALHALRNHARDRLGAMSALESAARRWSEEQRRRRERRAQAEADDRAAAQYLRLLAG